MRIQFFYDIVCPNSYIGFQLLRKKAVDWRKVCDVNIDYLPTAAPYVSNKVNSYLYDDVCANKHHSDIRECHQIAKYYGLEGTLFERSYEKDLRAPSTVPFLNVVRRQHPHWYEEVIDRCFKRIFVEGKCVSKVNDYLKITRKMGIPFKIRSDIIFKIENRWNVFDSHNILQYLIEAEKLADHEVTFSDILRLEWIDEAIKHPERLPKKFDVIENRKMVDVFAIPVTEKAISADAYDDDDVVEIEDWGFTKSTRTFH